MDSRLDKRVEIGPDGNLFVRAPAKVNLFLHITGRRVDGYHFLESLFSFTKKGDLLRFLPSKTLNFTVSGPFSETLEAEKASDNLVIRAAVALKNYTGVIKGAQIALEKNLPVASGLGGGSADAAAALLGLNALWKTGLSEKELTALALKLGADVPSCLSSSSQIVRGIGDVLVPVKLPWSAGIIIINPGVQVSTPKVFEAFRASRSRRELPPFDAPLHDAKNVISSIENLGIMAENSLQYPAEQLCPEIVSVIRFLANSDQSDLIRMSGSGASVFALYSDKAAAESVAQRAKEKNPDWWVMADTIGP